MYSLFIGAETGHPLVKVVGDLEREAEGEEEEGPCGGFSNQARQAGREK